MRRRPEATSGAGRASLRLALLLLASCGGAPPIVAADLAVRVDLPEGPVAFGAPFPLTVTRTWRRTLVPSVWDEDALDPLRRTLLETVRREDDAHVEETRRYRARAFSTGTLVLSPVAFRARPRAGGVPRTTDTGPLELTVTSALPPGDPGPPELPPGPRPAPRPWLPWLAGGAVLAVAVLARRLAKRRPPPVPSAAAGAPPPADSGPAGRARARLARLRDRAPADHDARQAWYGELAAILRDWAAERHGLDAITRSSEELAARLPDAGLGPPLGACDRVRFARAAPDAAERARLLDRAGEVCR